MPSVRNKTQTPPLPAGTPAPVLRTRAITTPSAREVPPRRHGPSPQRRPREADRRPSTHRGLPPTTPGPPPRSEQKTRHILVVEDDPTFTKLLTSLFDASDDFDYETVLAHSVKSALQRLAVGRFDVIIADLGLPDSKQYATLETLHGAAPQVPIVVITGTAEAGVGSSLEAIRRGASYFLRKGSVDRAAVERGIHYATERRDLREILSRDHHSERDQVERRV